MKFCRITLFAALMIISANGAAGSLLRFTCDGDGAGAEIFINGKFKGECPVDIQLPEGAYKLRVVKVDASREGILEQDIRMGDGVVKKLEADLWNKAENARDIATVQAYIEQYPAGPHIAAAREKFAAMRKAEGAVSVMIPIPGKIYEIGKAEVTQAQWQAVMGSNPSYFSRCGDACPVEQVSWDDIQIFLQKLNALTGKQYRLPTETEWVYACYGGSQTEYCGGNYVNSVGWFVGNSSYQTHPVGQKQANSYGLVDMTGNVLEWQSDCRDGDCSIRRLRGGSWGDDQQVASAADRSWNLSTLRRGYIGFRLARTLP